MSSKLVIVDSSAQAKKIAGFLGPDWRVESCRGRVRDLPQAELGVAVEADFQPTYTVLKGKQNLTRRLAKAMHDADEVYLATNPDPEGEATAWHLLDLAQLPPDKHVFRAAFPAITADAVNAALAEPRRIDMNMVAAQQTRRIVDRLVGYLVSPLASKTLNGRHSTGRVQSVCLRLIVEREREIADFQPQPFWSLDLTLAAGDTRLSAALHHIRGAVPHLTQQAHADKLSALLQDATFWVAKTDQSLALRNPPPPFTTDSLQQDAHRRLNLSPTRTMQLALKLHAAGYITYPYTDSVYAAPEAQAAARAQVKQSGLSEYVPVMAPVYETEEPRECIRPIAVHRVPPNVRGEGAALYNLIWRRFVASQMAPARYTITTALIQAGKSREQPFPLLFQAQHRALTFDGFLRVCSDIDPEGDAAPLPPLEEGQTLTLVETLPAAEHTQPPPRFTEASLVQALAERGIGRPATYANVVQAIQDREYVRQEDGHLHPTDSGLALSDYITAYFPHVFDEDYTAHLEAQFDRIAAGQTAYLKVLRDFWRVFQPQLHAAGEHLTTAQETTPRPLVLHPVEG